MTSRPSAGASGALKQNATEVERVLTGASAGITTSLKQSAAEVERSLTGVSTGVAAALKQNAVEVERSLLGVSAEVVRSFTAQAEEMTGTINQRSTELTRLLDEKGSAFLNTFASKGMQFATDMDRVTKDSLHAIETKGLAFTREMLSNSSEIAGIINDASTSASSALNRTLEDIHKNAKASVDNSRQTAAAAVAEVMETHALLRRDTTEVFERLRDANVLLQEVLSGATENLGKIEGSLSARVREFVATVTQVSDRGSQTSAKMEEHIRAFHGTTTAVLRDIATAAAQFDQHGRALAAAAEAINVGNGRTDAAMTERRTALEALIAELDGKSEDLDQRLVRFAKLLTDSLEAAESRTREVARIIAESSSSGSQAIAAQYDMVRATAEEERKRTADTLNTIYEQATGDIHALFAQAAERFSLARRAFRVAQARGGVAGFHHGDRTQPILKRDGHRCRPSQRRGEVPQHRAHRLHGGRHWELEQAAAVHDLNGMEDVVRDQ